MYYRVYKKILYDRFKQWQTQPSKEVRIWLSGFRLSHHENFFITSNYKALSRASRSDRGSHHISWHMNEHSSHMSKNSTSRVIKMSQNFFQDSEWTDRFTFFSRILNKKLHNEQFVSDFQDTQNRKNSWRDFFPESITVTKTRTTGKKHTMEKTNLSMQLIEDRMELRW